MDESFETLKEGVTPAEIAEACGDWLEAEVCEEIAAQEDVVDALQLAFTALEDEGIRFAEAIFKEAGILE